MAKSDFRFRAVQTVGSPSIQGAGGIETLATHSENPGAHPEYLKKTQLPVGFSLTQHLDPANKLDHAQFYARRAELMTSKLEYEKYKLMGLSNDPSNYMATYGTKPHLLTAYVLNQILLDVGITGNSSVFLNEGLVNDWSVTWSNPEQRVPTYELFLKLKARVDAFSIAGSAADLYLTKDYFVSWHDGPYTAERQADKDEVDTEQAIPGFVVCQWSTADNDTDLLGLTNPEYIDDDLKSVMSGLTWTSVESGRLALGNMVVGPHVTDNCFVCYNRFIESNPRFYDPLTRQQYKAYCGDRTATSTKPWSRKTFVYFTRMWLEQDTVLKLMGAADDRVYVFLDGILVMEHNNTETADVQSVDIDRTGWHNVKVLVHNANTNCGSIDGTLTNALRYSVDDGASWQYFTNAGLTKPVFYIPRGTQWIYAKTNDIRDRETDNALHNTATYINNGVAPTPIQRVSYSIGSYGSSAVHTERAAAFNESSGSWQATYESEGSDPDPIESLTHWIVLGRKKSGSNWVWDPNWPADQVGWLAMDIGGARMTDFKYDNYRVMLLTPDDPLYPGSISDPATAGVYTAGGYAGVQLALGHFTLSPDQYWLNGLGTADNDVPSSDASIDVATEETLKSYLKQNARAVKQLRGTNIYRGNVQVYIPVMRGTRILVDRIHRLCHCVTNVMFPSTTLTV